MARVVLPHSYTSPFNLLYYRLLAPFIGTPQQQTNRLTKIGHHKYGKIKQQLITK